MRMIRMRGLPDSASIQRWITSHHLGTPQNLRRWIDNHRLSDNVLVQRMKDHHLRVDRRALRRFRWRPRSIGDLPEGFLEKVRLLETVEDWRVLLGRSLEAPVLLYRHSRNCPVSSFAAHEIKVLLEVGSPPPELVVGMVLLPENPAVSNRIAEDTGVLYQSPQVILLDGGQAVWHTSHGGINVEALSGAVNFLVTT